MTPVNPLDADLSATDWRSLAVLFTGNVLFAAGLVVHALLFNFYLRALGHSATAMGYQVAAMTVGGLCGLLPAGLVIDSRGTRTALLGGVTVTVAGLALTAVVPSQAAIYAGAFVVGVGGATCRVSWGPAIMRLTTAQSRARAFAWNTALLIGSGAAWTAASGFLYAWLTRVGAHAAYSPLQLALLASAAVSACALPLYALLPAAHRDRAARSMTIIPPPDVRLLVPLVAFWMLAAALVLPFFNVFFADRFHMSVTGIGTSFGLVHALTALALLGAAEIARRWGARRLLIAWMVLMAPALLGLSFAGTMSLALALYFVQGVVGPATNPLIDQLLLERTSPERHGIVAGWRNAAAEASGALGATAGGRLLDATSFPTLFSIAAVVAAVAAITLGLSLRTGATDALLPEQRAA